jgi:hypothetical protein
MSQWSSSSPQSLLGELWQLIAGRALNCFVEKPCEQKQATGKLTATIPSQTDFAAVVVRTLLVRIGVFFGPTS